MTKSEANKYNQETYKLYDFNKPIFICTRCNKKVSYNDTYSYKATNLICRKCSSKYFSNNLQAIYDYVYGDLELESADYYCKCVRETLANIVNFKVICYYQEDKQEVLYLFLSESKTFNVTVPYNDTISPVQTAQIVLEKLVDKL